MEITKFKSWEHFKAYYKKLDNWEKALYALGIILLLGDWGFSLLYLVYLIFDKEV